MPEYKFDIADAVVGIRVVADDEATARQVLETAIDQLESIQRVNDCQVSITLDGSECELYAVDGKPVFEDTPWPN